MATQTSGPAGGRFAFLVPVVHPGGRKVSDYGVVERALRETLRSYTAQDHPDVVVIVVCHRVPAWAGEFRERVRFIELAEHPNFTANANGVEVDKGMKYMLGAIHAIAVEKAARIMTADADDFVRRDTARFILSQDLGSHDGFIIREGYNALVNVRPDTLRIVKVFRVRDFDRTCGTCRIFSPEGILPSLAKLDPDILALGARLAPDADGVIRPDKTVLDHLWAITAPVANEHYETIHLLGRHSRQGRGFDFLPLFEPLAGKACGHGNHDGPSRGEIRWSGVRGVADGQAFLESFGLRGGAIELGGPEPALWARGAAIGALNGLRKALGIDFGYEKQHALDLKPGK